MINEDLKQILNLLALPRKEIIKHISEGIEGAIYYDRDSEDGGTEFIEVALLRLCRDVFMSPEEMKSEVQERLDELSWLTSIFLENALVYDRLHTIRLEKDITSYDHFWEVVKRYAGSVLSVANVDQVRPTFSFLEKLTEYNYRVLVMSE